MTDLPAELADTAARLTRRARRARSDDVERAHVDRRDELLEAHGYVARVRDEETRVILVLYPADWIDEDGVVRTDRIEDIDRAVEIQLEGPEDPDDWEAVDEHNRRVVARVQDEYGADHAANATAFADFMGNHYAKPIQRATEREREEFRTEYYRRNVWPTDEQAACVEESLDIAIEVGSALANEES